MTAIHNTRHSRTTTLSTLLLLVLLALCSPVAFNYNNLPASLVIGQPDFTSGLINQGGPVGANTLRNPTQTLVMNGQLLLADSENNRVLIFKSIPATNNVSADLVIGQKDLLGGTPNQTGIPETTQDPTARTLDRPSALATDGTRLFVLDRDNHRVLIYNQLPAENNAAADVVIGHSTFTTRTYCGESAFNDTKDLGPGCLSSGPTGMVYDADTGKLIVFDSDNDRVLIWNHVPTTNGTPADVVIGQPDFTHNTTNQGSIGANTLNLSSAAGLGTYRGKLLIADRLNNRVLIFNSIPTTNNASADVVIGQDTFTDSSPNKGGAISASGLHEPRSVQVDSNGRLFITEAKNARILIFNTIPTSNGASADIVIGQPDFASGAGSTTRSTFQTFVSSITFFEDKLIVVDQGNYRILIFALGAPTFGTVTSSSVQVLQPYVVSLANKAEYQWRIRRNGSTVLGLNPISTPSITDGTLEANSLYSYDVSLDNGTSFQGDYGASATVRTLANAPVNLIARNVTTGTITVSVDPFPNHSSGRSGYFFSNTTRATVSGWIQTNSWSEADLSCGMRYEYSVMLRNHDGIQTNPIVISVATSPCSN